MSLFDRIKIKEKPLFFIRKDLMEKKPLPQGAKEFEEWSDRIIKNAGVKAEDYSLKFALANMIMHLGPTESFKEDAFFIHQLRKSASNQVAQFKIEEIKAARKAKMEEDKKLTVVE